VRDFFLLSRASPACAMASAEKSTWAQGPGLPTVWPRAFYFTFQAEDAFLPVRAALNVETCQFQSPYCSCRAPHF
jgi:hypothetical protein